MKLLNYLKVKKNRDLLIIINVALSVGLALISVVIDEKYGTAGLTSIYVLQVICVINWIIAFPLLIWNIWHRSKIKLERRDKNLGRDK
ncbi:MAG: hypothetical protein RR444_01030 [Oscillospiraceae bacterium]